MRLTSASSRSEAGSINTVQPMLNAVCTMAMPESVALSFRIAGAKIALIRTNRLSQTTVPMILNIRCTSAARRALRFVPTEEISAVTQVPMFCPMMIGTAAPKVT